MPLIKIDNKSIECSKGQNLRKVLLLHSFNLYNNNAKYLNCRGIGTCGSCAVEVKGKVQPSVPGLLESKRIELLSPQNIVNLRLACYCKVIENIEIVKHKGFWGEINKNSL